MFCFSIHQTDSQVTRIELITAELGKERQSLEPHARIKDQVSFKLVWMADGKVITIK